MDMNMETGMDVGTEMGAETEGGANRISPIKAIRLKCLECSGGSWHEVKLCPAEGCALHPFRFGKNPYRKKRELSPERREQMRQHLLMARTKRGNAQSQDVDVEDFLDDDELDELEFSDGSVEP